jgi:hypothetical protein
LFAPLSKSTHFSICLSYFSFVFKSAFLTLSVCLSIPLYHYVLL